MLKLLKQLIDGERAQADAAPSPKTPAATNGPAPKPVVLSEDDRLLAFYHERDNDVGLPTMETLKERYTASIKNGHWKCAIDCIAKGVPIEECVSMILKIKPIQKPIDRDYITHSFDTALMHAVYAGRADVVGDLLKLGACVDGASSARSRFVTYHDTRAPISVAAAMNDSALVQLLAENNAADLHEALREAEKRDYRDIIKIIRAEETRRASGKNAHQEPAIDPRAVSFIAAIETSMPDDRVTLLEALRRKFPSEFAKAAGVMQPAAAPDNMPALDAATPISKKLTLKDAI